MSDAELQRIALACGQLPLGIRIAASQLHTDPWPEASEPGTGAEHGAHLADFDDGERNLAAVLAYSLGCLPRDLVALFAVLGLHEGPDFDALAVAALSDAPVPVTRRRLRLLLNANLITKADRPGSYCLHDVLRSLSRDRAATFLPEADRRAAVERLTDYYVRAIDAADRMLTPDRHREGLAPQQGAGRTFRTYADALGWVAGEQDNLVAVCRSAAAEGLNERCWQLAFAFRSYLFIRKNTDLWRETHEIAVEAARRSANVRAEAVTLNNLGLAIMFIGDYVGAAERYDRARTLFTAVGDAHGEHTSLAHLAWVRFRQGDVARAYDESLTALRFMQREDAPRNTAILLRDTAVIELELGRTSEAIARLCESVEMFGELGLPVDAAMALNCLGEAECGRGRSDEADRVFTRAAELSCTWGSIFEGARAHEGLAGTAARRFEWDRARSHWNRALDYYVSLHDSPRQDRVRERLADLPLEDGDTSGMSEV